MLCVKMMYHDCEDKFSPYFVPHQLFGSIPRSMLTLFNICLLCGDWDGVYRGSYEEDTFLFVLFTSFTFGMNFALLNVIVGVVMDNILCIKDAQEQESLAIERSMRVKLLHILKELCRDMDKND